MEPVNADRLHFFIELSYSLLFLHGFHSVYTGSCEAQEIASGGKVSQVNSDSVVAFAYYCTMRLQYPALVIDQLPVYGLIGKHG